MNTAVYKNPMSSEMVLLSYAPLTVDVRGFLHFNFIGGRRLHLRRLVMLLCHTVKLLLSSYCTYVAYLYRVTAQPVLNSGERP